MTTFFCVVDRRSGETRELFRSSCHARGLDFRAIDAETFDFAAPSGAVAGDLLYQVSTGAQADMVANHVAVEGVVQLQDGRDRSSALPQLRLERAGVPVVDAVPCRGRNRGTIRRAVEVCGGLPVVVKVPGGQGGIGVMVIESWRSLMSVLDFVAELGTTPTLSRFVADATHWRCIILGESVFFSYLNAPIDEDFRTAAPIDLRGYEANASTAVCAVAVRASTALGVEFAGVDVLIGDEDPQVLEVNSPCYFAAAQLIGGVDISGAIIDRLIAKQAPSS